jgi:hypothetical protein
VDAFLAGWSLFFVAKRQPERPVQGSALRAVRAGEDGDQAAGGRERIPYLALAQRCRRGVRALPLMDRALRISGSSDFSGEPLSGVVRENATKVLQA